MTKRFRPWDPKQKWLLPPEITEFIPEGHPAHLQFYGSRKPDHANQERIRAVLQRPGRCGRQGKHGSKAATHAKNGKPGSLVARMREKLKRGGWRSPYRLRKQIVEPVFGHDESDRIRGQMPRKSIDCKPPRSQVEPESRR